MKISETVSRLIASDEKAFKDIPEARATKLVQLALKEIAKEIDDTDEGRVSVQGLGVFIVKQVEREKADGVTAAQRRVAFRSKPGAAKKSARTRRKAAE